MSEKLQYNYVNKIRKLKIRATGEGHFQLVLWSWQELFRSPLRGRAGTCAAGDISLCPFPSADVERRRIYDIVNVLESLHMVSRLARNRYVWHGRHNLPQTLQALKKVGEENKYIQQIQMIKRREYEHEFDADGERNEEMASSFGSSEQSEMSFVELPGVEFRAGNNSL